MQAGGHEFESHHLQVIMRSAAELYRAGKRCALVRNSLDAMDGTDIRRISVNEKSEAFLVLRCESSEKQISLLFIMKYVP